MAKECSYKTIFHLTSFSRKTNDLEKSLAATLCKRLYNKSRCNVHKLQYIKLNWLKHLANVSI